MDLKGKFLRTLNFLHRGEQPVMSFEHLMLLLMVDQAGAITIGDLAKRLNVSQQFISQIETGDSINLTLDTLIKLAKSLNRGIKISFTKISKGDPLFTVA